MAVVMAGAAVAGPMEDAQAALLSNDYATELRLVKPLADQGNAKAQNMLGDIFDYGLGVPEDYATAAAWYRKAAEQGDIDGQYFLGIMYLFGSAELRDCAHVVQLGGCAG